MILNENILQHTTGCHQGAREQHREGSHCCVDLRLTCVCDREARYSHFIPRKGEGVGAAKQSPRDGKSHQNRIQPQDRKPQVTLWWANFT